MLRCVPGCTGKRQRSGCCSTTTSAPPDRRASRRNSMATTRKVIITCAVTGAIHTPSMSPYLPVSAAEIADAALEAAAAGAAIVHLHARDPRDGRPSQDPDHFLPILQAVKKDSDAVLNITTGGSPHMTVAERMRPALEFRPELASLNMGSMNFGLYPMLDRFGEFEY